MKSYQEKLEQLYCVFDTETTGAHEGSRVIELAWKVVDKNENVFSSESYLINPSGEWEMSDGAESVHGISKKQCQDKGENPKKVYNEFIKTVEDNNCILIGHNVEFDISMVNENLKIEGIDGDMYKFKTYCTMKDPNHKDGIRIFWPKLIDLYFELFEEKFEGSHRAMVDVNATVKCFLKLFKDDNLESFTWNESEKFYLFVPFNEKDDAKKAGAMWDNSKKKWFVNSITSEVERWRAN
jgi:DNA polymerase III epsilon subunit-like protein